MLKVAELFSLEAFWCSSRVRSLADFFSFEVSHQKSESCWRGEEEQSGAGAADGEWRGGGGLNLGGGLYGGGAFLGGGGGGGGGCGRKETCPGCFML